MTKQGAKLLVENFDSKFPHSTFPDLKEVKGWLKAVGEGLGVSGMNKAYKVLDAHMIKKYQMRLF